MTTFSPVGEPDNIPGGVLGAQPGGAAKVARDRTGSAAVRKREIERYVPPGCDRQPVGDLLSVVKRRKTCVSRPRRGVRGLCAHHKLRAEPVATMAARSSLY